MAQSKIYIIKLAGSDDFVYNNINIKELNSALFTFSALLYKERL